MVEAGASPWICSAAVPIGRPRVRAWASDELAVHGVEADHVNIWQTVGKRRRRHGLLMSGEPREPGYRVEGLRWEAKRVKSAVRAVETAQPH